MKRNLMFLAVAAVGFASCKSGFKQGEAGMQYRIVEHKGGATIQQGDFVSLQGIIKTEGDSVLSSTYEMGHPSGLVVPKPQFKGDLISALLLLSEGDSAVVKLNIDSMMKKSPGQPRPTFKGKTFVYTLRIEKVISKGKLSDQVFQGRVQEYFKGMSAKAKADEPVKIKKYIDDNKLNLTKTASGLNYVITKPGTGEKPNVGDTVEVNYTGKFLNGKVFDTSVKEEAQKSKTYQAMRPYKPARIPVGVKAVIPGWDEGLLLLTKGSKATFVIPSILGYGEQGGGQVIPPFSPLVFDIEIVNIIHPNPNAPKPVAPSMMQAQPQTRK